MEFFKFVLAGEDKAVLSRIKNALTSNGHIYLGYSKDPVNVLKLVKRNDVDLIIIDVANRFRNLRETLSIIDEELVAPCILLLDIRNDEVFEFLRKSRIMTYVTKPIFDENFLQITDISRINYERVIEYEQKVKKLNDTLESRKVVEKAKWILVEQNGLSEAEAYESIKRRSRDSRVPMKNIAEALILTRGIS